MTNLINEQLESMITAANSHAIFSKHKAANALLPYAIFLEQRGQRRMIDAIFRAGNVSKSSNFLWPRVLLYVTKLFERQSPTSLNRVIVLVAPYLTFHYGWSTTTTVVRWAEAVLGIQYTEEVSESIVHGLLGLAGVELLRQHIPIDIWRLLKRLPNLPPTYHGEMWGGNAVIIDHIRGLGDIEILKSYLLINWLDRLFPSPDVAYEMEQSIRLCFAGAEMEGHRNDLIKRLNDVLTRLNTQLGDLQPNPQMSREDSLKAITRYAKLKDALVEMSGK